MTVGGRFLYFSDIFRKFKVDYNLNCIGHYYCYILLLLFLQSNKWKNVRFYMNKIESAPSGWYLQCTVSMNCIC